MDCSLPGSSVHGFLQARILEYVAMLTSRGSFLSRAWTCIFHTEVRFFTSVPPGKTNLSFYGIVLSYILRCSYVWLIYIYNCFSYFLDWSLDDYIVSFVVSYSNCYFKVPFPDRNTATPHYFWFPFARNRFFHSLTFSLYVSLSLIYVSCRQYLYGFFFFLVFSQSMSLCLDI